MGRPLPVTAALRDPCAARAFARSLVHGRAGAVPSVGPRSFACVALVLAAVLLSGCADEAGPGAPRWEVGGTFTEDASQQDLDDLEARLAYWDATLVVMESYPMQYRVTVDDGPACDEVRDMLVARAYVRDVGACRAVA